MDTQFKKIKAIKYQEYNEDYNVDGQFWSKFKSVSNIKESSGPSHIECSPVAPYDTLVVSSTKVNIYDLKSNQVKRSITRFKDIVHCASYRLDGKLIAAGDASGKIQVFEANSRSILRTFTSINNQSQDKNKITQGIRTVKFLSSNTQIVSGGDDFCVRVWDVPSGQLVNEWKDIHQDYVRCSSISRQNQNIFMTGSYDKTVKIFDARVGGQCVMSLDHSMVDGISGNPVESVLSFPGDSLVASSAGSYLYVWDILGGSQGRLMQTPVSNHQKTITSITNNYDCSRLITASLDQSVKVWDTSNWEIVHSYKYSSPLLSVALSRSNTHLFAGSVNGNLNIKQRQFDPAVDIAAPKQENIFQLGPKLTSPKNRYERDLNAIGGSRAFFLRGQQRPPTESEIVIQTDRKKPKLKSFEKSLKKFAYREALDLAFNGSFSVPTIVALLIELKLRGDGLLVGLSGRNDEDLLPILQFIHKNLLNPRYFQILMQVLDLIINRYGNLMHSSLECQELVKRIRVKVKQEVETQIALQQLNGAIEMVSNFSGCALDMYTTELQGIDY